MFFIKKILLLQLFFVLLGTTTFAQGELETSREPDKYNLNSYGIKLNSNGYGGYYSFSTPIDYRHRRFIEAEYNYMKSPKEVKIINPIFNSLTVRKFVFGKTHSAHNFKFGYGYNRMIFEKRDKNSISIHCSGSGGVSLGISKPIYYEIVDSVKTINDYQVAYTSYYRIDINIQNNATDILGKAPIILGMNEIKLHPGIYVKFGLSFDFSKDVMKAKILETGCIYDFYLRPVEIMAGQESSNYLYLYISYIFGNKYDARINRDYRLEQKRKTSKGN
jgi:hypothetical protein